MRRIWLPQLLAFGLATLGVSERCSAGDSKTVRPFNGITLNGWKLKGKQQESRWVIGQAVMDEKNPSKLIVSPTSDAKFGQLVNMSGGGVSIYTEAQFADCIIDLEFLLPKGSDSGVYVHGEYQVRLVDSYGKEKPGADDMGGLEGAAAPKVNAAKKPGEWQRLVIEFQAPRFENGKRTTNAKFIKITLNDTVIHDNVDLKGPTPSGVTGKEAPTGPLMFQGGHGPVSLRNIKITPR